MRLPYGRMFCRHVKLCAAASIGLLPPLKPWSPTRSLSAPSEPFLKKGLDSPSMGLASTLRGALASPFTSAALLETPFKENHCTERQPLEANAKNAVVSGNCHLPESGPN